MNNKDEFINIDCYHYFRKDEIIGFKSIGGDNGDYDEMCKGDYDSYIEFYFKNGTSRLVSFGDDKYCNQWRDAYIIYLEEVFVSSTKKQYERLNQILMDRNPEDYKNTEEKITQKDMPIFEGTWDELNSFVEKEYDPNKISEMEANEGRTIKEYEKERGNNV